MLEPLFGSTHREQVLLYLIARDEGYAREIARFFGAHLDPVQKQLERLEAGGVLVSRAAGRTVLYSFNPRYPFATELRALLQRTLAFLPDEYRDRLLLNRRRPRRHGKPL